MIKANSPSQVIVDAGFLDDVKKGLSAVPKFLHSKYFYDHRGDELFQQIMSLPEYYLTGCEHEILSDNKNNLLSIIKETTNDFNLIEFGAGDGYKTKILLKHFLEERMNFNYCPIDISGNALKLLINNIKDDCPGLVTKPIRKDYFRALKGLNKQVNKPKVILFLGSNIGNLLQKEALKFLRKLSRQLSKNDLLLIGFDLKKHPRIIENAYNDNKGVTKAFNLNLLERINEEFGGNFDITNFDHFPTYNPETGEAKSYLVSNEEQLIYVKALDTTFHFAGGEFIYTEVSKKYDLNQIEAMSAQAGFTVKRNFVDSKGYFVDSLWTLK